MCGPIKNATKTGSWSLSAHSGLSLPSTGACTHSLKSVASCSSGLCLSQLHTKDIPFSNSFHRCELNRTPSGRHYQIRVPYGSKFNRLTFSCALDRRAISTKSQKTRFENPKCADTLVYMDASLKVIAQMRVSKVGVNAASMFIFQLTAFTTLCCRSQSF